MSERQYDQQDADIFYLMQEKRELEKKLTAIQGEREGEGTMSAAAVLAFIGALTVVAGFVSALVIAATYTTVGVLYLIGRIRGTHR